MHKLIDYICDELDELERKADKGLSMAEVQYMDTLAHAKKNLMKTEELGDYSNRGYSRGRYYVDGSYGRRRDRGYSMATGDMVHELRELMKDAPDEHTKREFEKFISKIETM